MHAAAFKRHFQTSNARQCLYSQKSLFYQFPKHKKQYIMSSSNSDPVPGKRLAPVYADNTPQQQQPKSESKFFSRLVFNNHHHQLDLLPTSSSTENVPKFVIIGQPYTNFPRSDQIERIYNNIRKAGGCTQPYSEIIKFSSKEQEIRHRNDPVLSQIDDYVEKAVTPEGGGGGGLIVICDIPTIQILRNNIEQRFDRDARMCLRFVEVLQKHMSNKNKKVNLVCLHSDWLLSFCFPNKTCVLPVPEDLTSLVDDASFQIPREFSQVAAATSSTGKRSAIKPYYHVIKRLMTNSSSSDSQQRKGNNNSSVSSSSISSTVPATLLQQEDNEQNLLGPFHVENKIPNSLKKGHNLFIMSDEQNGDGSNDDSSQQSQNNSKNNSNQSHTDNRKHETTSSSSSRLRPIFTNIFGGIFGSEDETAELCKEVINNPKQQEDETEENQNPDDEDEEDSAILTSSDEHFSQQANEPEPKAPQNTNLINDGLTAAEREEHRRHELHIFKERTGLERGSCVGIAVASKVPKETGDCPNKALVDHLYQIAELQNADIRKDSDKFSVKAYKSAAYQIRQITFKLESSSQIPEHFRHGIGEKIRLIIDQFLQQGTTARLEVMKQNPKIVAQQKLVKIWGVGDKTAAVLVNKYGVYSVEELRNNPEAVDSLTDIQRTGLEYYEDLLERIPRAEIEVLQNIVATTLTRAGFDISVESTGEVRKSVRGVSGYSVAGAMSSLARNTSIDSSTGNRILTRGKVQLVTGGSFRRGLPTSGDIDILMCIDDAEFAQLLPCLLQEFRDQVRETKEVENRNAHGSLYRPPMPTGFDLFETLIGDSTYKSTNASGGHRKKHNNLHLNRTWLGLVRAARCANPQHCPLQHKPDGSHYTRRMDLKCYRPQHYAFAVLYFTGSAFFNRAMRLFAQKNGYYLNDFNLIRCTRTGGKKYWAPKIHGEEDDSNQGEDNGDESFAAAIPCSSEREIFTALGLKRYLEPAERDISGTNFQYFTGMKK